MSTYVEHDHEHLPRAERCDCESPDIKAIWGLGYGPTNIITVYCERCGHDFMSIWPKGSLHEDGWPKDWTRPPAPTHDPAEGETDADWLENRGIGTGETDIPWVHHRDGDPCSPECAARHPLPVRGPLFLHGDDDIGRCDLCGTEEGERRRITLPSGLTAWVCRLCKGTADQHAYDLAESHLMELEDRG